MNERVKHFLVLALGWIFILFGILGLFLPFLQGFIFLFIGLYILSHKSERAKSLLIKLKERYPNIYIKFDNIKAKYESKIKQFFNKLR